MNECYQKGFISFGSFEILHILTGEHKLHQNQPNGLITSAITKDTCNSIQNNQNMV